MLVLGRGGEGDALERGGCFFGPRFDVDGLGCLGRGQRGAVGEKVEGHCLGTFAWGVFERCVEGSDEVLLEFRGFVELWNGMGSRGGGGEEDKEREEEGRDS